MKSATEDITLDDFPPTRRYPVPRPEPKQYTTEEIREMWRKLRELGPQLAEATEQMNEALCTIEDLIVERLGEDARGRVELQRGETPIYEKRKKGKPPRLIEKRPWVEFLVYRDTEMFVESNKSGGSRFESTHILSTSREMRILACHKIEELWVACGGKLPIRKESGVNP